MASGSAPAGKRGVRIRPLLPDNEVPRGEARIGSQYITISAQTGSTK